MREDFSLKSPKNTNNFIAHEILFVFIYSLPWNQSTLFGYIGEILFTVMLAPPYFTVLGVIFVLFISICMLHQAFYKIFEYSINKWDAMTTDDKNKCNNKHFLCDLIRFHILIKE